MSFFAVDHPLTITFLGSEIDSSWLTPDGDCLNMKASFGFVMLEWLMLLVFPVLVLGVNSFSRLPSMSNGCAGQGPFRPALYSGRPPPSPNRKCQSFHPIHGWRN